MEFKKVSVLISSCDSFSDCWGPYCHGIKKYWPDCPYDVFTITNYKDVGDDRVKALKIGEDRGWSANTLEALKSITTPYILYTHEDFWISKEVDTRVIEDYVTLMDQDKADYIRLFPCPEPDFDFPFDDRLGILADEASYRTSLQVALWRKSVCEELIVGNENPWQFEKQGTLRSRRYGNRFLSVKRFFDDENRPYHYGIEYVCTAINKGRWSKAAKAYVQKEGLNLDLSHRPHETWWHDFIRGSRVGAICRKVVNAFAKDRKIISLLKKS